MSALAAALAASLIWGVADFVGGVAARAIGALRVTLLTYIGAVAVLAVVALAWHGRWSTTVLLAGLAAGAASALGFVTFNAALVAGSMGIVSSVVAMMQQLVPVVVAVGLHGQRLSGPAWAGVAAAVVGGLMLGWSHPGGRGLPPRAVALSVVSGVAFGLSVVALAAAPGDSGAVPGLLEHGTGLLVVAAVWAARHGSRTGAVARLVEGAGHHDAVDPRSVRFALVCGAMMATANVALLFALRHGDLAIVGVVVALYPLSTAVLARALLQERLAAHQTAGIAVALGACALLALA